MQGNKDHFEKHCLSQINLILNGVNNFCMLSLFHPNALQNNQERDIHGNLTFVTLIVNISH